MNHFGFPSKPDDIPAPGNRDWLATGLLRWAESAPGRELRDSRARRVLEAVLGNSRFLTQCALAEPELMVALATDGPDAAWRGIMAGLAAERPDDDAALQRMLRIGKRRVALIVGVADLTGAWTLGQVTGALSRFAEFAIGRAAAHLLRATARRGAFTLPDPNDPEHGSGLVILGMGKLGGGELNYSSDVDLIVLYDSERIATGEPDALQNHFVRLTRGLVRILEERTRDGYVFRTDLRLRPDPGSTPIALSVLAAETYYESLGQNWERAAMIKARPVAGDMEAGRAFLGSLRPFIWRRSLDFAAIRDIHAIKRQINAHRGGAAIAVAGHNVKLGRGGIREIEFFVQTQQLIWGGRDPRLRPRATLDSLRALVETGKTTPDSADELSAAYHFLRRVEHRLQMIGDEQTHTLPRDHDDLGELATFLGFDGADAFAERLLHHLRRVEHHYANLFEDGPGDDHDVPGNLVFTGDAADPDTLETLTRLGFRSPKTVDDTIRGWHHGHTGATRSTRSREVLTELHGVILGALARTPDPDATFLKFDGFLRALPSGVQLFSMIRANPQLLDLVAEILGCAPRLAAHLGRHPQLLEGVVAGGFFAPPPPPEALDEELDRVLAQAEGLEDVLDLIRRWAGDRGFQVGIQVLRGLIGARIASEALSNVADTALSRLLPRIEDAFAERHGRVPGDGLAIVAMGKLGGREMTPTSDLDLIFVYHMAAGAEASDGTRPLVPTQYYARLSQRLINALTAQTNEGPLYEVDMRLRPSGHAGPIASSFEAFAKYHAADAWTWEHMALTRARVIAGPPALRRKVEAVIRDTLTRPRDPDALLRDVAAMRARMDAEHHTEVPWEVKHVRGGLVDIEFIAQFLQLRHAADDPDVLAANTRTALERLRGAGRLDAGDGETLLHALDLWQGLQLLLRLTVEGRVGGADGADVPQALHGALARIGEVPDRSALLGTMRDTAAAVLAVYERLIAAPAAALPSPESP